ncbi:MAG: hypothetical protein LBC42_02330 [Puniceicoccales bacterium]|jgi:hypothetical protein|nr:hypothetical protein [Puniceicoccales bacterium]
MASALLEELLRAMTQERNFSIFAGFDGAVDQIYAVERCRTAEAYERMDTIEEFAKRVASAAGRSTNIERRLIERRAGGNAVLCATALQQLGCKITFLGNIGNPIEEVFQNFSSKCVNCHSIGRPNATDALEFNDGKILLTDSSPLEALNVESLRHFPIKNIPLSALMERQDAIVLTNWTMMPKGTEIYQHLLHKVFPLVPRNIPVLFDIADPARRSDGEILTLLDILCEFSRTRTIFLSINGKELERLANLLGLKEDVQYAEMLCQLHGRWPIEWTLHLCDGAESFGINGFHRANGFFTERPHTSTGGGDNFNGGFLFGILLGLRRELALLLGNAVSGAYVRIGHSPGKSEVEWLLREKLLLSTQ